MSMLRPVLAVLTLLFVVGVGGPASATAQAAVCDAPVVNEVACENSKPGADPSTWQINRAGDDSIQGFATAMSVNRGETIGFKIKSATSNYRIDILRLGYYGGDGARLIQGGLAPTGSSSQPSCQTFQSSGLIDCGNWSVSRSWTVPATAVSGVYIAHLVRNDNGDESHIVFVVRDDAGDAQVVMQTADATWQAYNTYGGNSLYTCEPQLCPPEGNPLTYKAAYKVSYNRPFRTALDDSGRSWLFSGGEYPLIRFMEANGYDMSYVSSVDMHRRGNVLLGRNHKVLVSSGHDEYWSASQRASMESARSAGINLAFFTGNTGFWKTRWEPSAAGAATQDRTLVSYKDTHFSQQVDPVEFTGTWRDPRLTTPAAGPTPENALTGLSFLVNSGTSRITVPYAFRQMRMWRNTAATSLPPGGALNLAPQTLGYEWDVDADNGFRPSGLAKLSATTATGLEVFTDYGSKVKLGGTATHNITMYKAPSGARVFNTGTVQWSWGLDAENEAGNPADRNMQQATLNVFADLGAQPYAPLPGLVRATATTDTTAPSAAITSLPGTVADGTRVTIAGTASDTGGVVAGVEISTDGGATWHPASGTTAWTYSWVAHGNPTTVVKVRAVDDSANLSTPGAGSTVAVTCPCSIWGTNVTPPDPDSGENAPIEVGVKFRSDRFGTVSGIRFYKSAANTGTHTGSLWTADGQLLRSAVFSNESSSGWQTVTFSSPVQIEPDTTYVASYHAPNGHYAATADYFQRNPAPGPNGGAITDSPPLHALRNTGTTVETTTNGVYAYSPTSTFPNGSYAAANYWVDVVFSPTAVPGQVTDVSATAGGSSSANVTWTAPASGGTVTSYRITPYAGATAGTPKTITGTPPATGTTITGLTTGTTYRFTVQALNPNGGGTVSALSNAVTPAGAVAPAAPTGVAAEAASQMARVSWTAPGADGDSPITGYTVTPYIGGTAQTPVQAGAAATSATVTGLTNGTAYTFKVAAANAVGAGPQSAASAPVTPQATLFDFATPAGSAGDDPSAVELGVKFTATTGGQVTGIRFYKDAANTGTHVGSLWAATGGPPLARATFTGETASGWQSVSFATPVTITAGTTYIASYHAPRGNYAATVGGLANAVTNGPLRTIADSASVNGVYAYAATSTFPGSSYRATNYWVDVTFAMTAPGTPTGVTAAESGPTSADVSWSAPATGGPATSYRITPYAGATAGTPKTISGSPPATSTTMTGLTSGTTYRFTVQALNANGAGPASAQSNPVTPTAAVAPTAPAGVVAQPAGGAAQVSWTPASGDGGSPVTGQTVTPYAGATALAPVAVGPGATSTVVSGLTNGTAYTFRVSATNAVGTGPQSAPSAAITPRATLFGFPEPATLDSGETDPIELGVKFTPDFNGSVTGLRFYKAGANTGTHVGSLWTANGDQRLRQVTFTGETASGWQTALFSSPVDVTAGTTYVASYFAPNGHYSVTAAAFNAAVTSGPLTAPATTTTPNGVYAYGAASSFPASSFGAANYHVDVLYAPGSPPGPVSGVSASAGPSSATVAWTAPSSGGPVTAYKITPYIGATAQPATTVTGSPPATSRTLTGLTAGTEYTFTVQATNPGGAGPESAPSAPVTPTGAAVPGAPTAVAAQGDSKSAVVGWSAPASDGGSAITGYVVTPFAGAEAGTPVSVGPGTTRTRVTGLANGTAYTFRVAAANAAGTGAASAASAAVTPRASILDLGTPAVADSGETDAVVLGVKFRADVAGSITGLRFYKAPGNTGTHVGGLWGAGGGAPIAQAAFTGETASGWQTLTFTSPVPITAGTTYVAGYLAPNGRYSYTASAFADDPIVNGPLRALDAGTSPNGVYAYSSSLVFPSSSWQATNYWVDVLFAPAA